MPQVKRIFATFYHVLTIKSSGQQSQMYVNVSRSQTEEPKVEYTAYQATGSQHLSQQQQQFLTETDFGHPPHATSPAAKEEPSIFSTSQSQQSQQQSSMPGTASPAESSVSGAPEVQQEQPTLADYNQSTSKGHEILSQVTFQHDFYIQHLGNFEHLPVFEQI